MTPRRSPPPAFWAPTALLAFASLAPLAAAAQLPSYARPDPSPRAIRGTIEGFDGRYHLTLHDDRGYLDDVTLHRGTVIAPPGTRLARGMRVAIAGRAAGKTFEADEIDVAEEPTAYASESPSYSKDPPPSSMPSSPYDLWNGSASPSYGYPYYPYYGLYPYSAYYPNYPFFPYASPVIVIPGQTVQPAPQPSPFPHNLRRPLPVHVRPYIVPQPFIPRSYAAPRPIAPPAGPHPTVHLGGGHGGRR